MKSQVASSTVRANSTSTPFQFMKNQMVTAWNIETKKNFVSNQKQVQQQSSVRPTQCKKSFLGYGPSDETAYQSSKNATEVSTPSGSQFDFLLFSSKMKTETSKTPVQKNGPDVPIIRVASDKQDVIQLIQSLSEDKKFKTQETDRNSIKEQTDESHKLYKQIQNLQADLNKYRTQIQKLQEGNNDSPKPTGLKKICLHEAEVLEIEQLNLQISNSKQELQKVTKAILDQKNNFEIEIERLKQLIQNAQSDGNQNQSENEENLQRQKSEIDRLTENQENLEKQIKKLKQTISELEAQIKDNQKNNKQGTDQQSKDSDLLKQQLEQQNKEIEKLKQNIKDLELKLKESQANEQNLGQENTKLKQSVSELNKQISTMKNNSSDSNSQNSSQQGDIEALKKKCQDSDAKNVTSLKKIEELILANSKLEADLLASNKKLQEQSTAATLSNTNLKNELEDWKKKFLDMQILYEADIKEIEKLELIIEEMEKELEKKGSGSSSQTNEQITHFQGEVEIWKKKFVELNRSHYTVKESLMLKEAENQALIQQQAQKPVVKVERKQTTLRSSKGPESESLRSSQDSMQKQ